MPKYQLERLERGARWNWVNGYQKSNERGPCTGRQTQWTNQGRDVFPALAALVGQAQNVDFVFLTVYFFNSFVLIAQQAWQGVVLGRLSLSMFLLYQHWKICLRYPTCPFLLRYQRIYVKYQENLPFFAQLENLHFLRIISIISWKWSLLLGKFLRNLGKLIQ